jgi:hypothetical protein
MPFPDGALHGHISIGVVEHREAGPHGFLAEFHRTLAPGGVLLLTVPWVNYYRRLSAQRIRKAQTMLRTSGVPFYQYAFEEVEIRAFLEETGFELVRFYPYSPARGLCEFPLLSRIRRYHTRRSSGVTQPVGRDSRPLSSPFALTRRLIYWTPVLRMFAHMILAVARKPVG